MPKTEKLLPRRVKVRRERLLPRCRKSSAETEQSDRGQRAKARKHSLLEGIPGVGAKRRRELLRHFGSAKAIENASVEELSKIKGISDAVARTIYDHLHTVND